MKRLKEKMRLIYKPFLIIAICFTPIYTLLNWLLIIKTGLPVQEIVVNFALPFCLPWIPVLIWLRPSIKLLAFKKEGGPFAYMFLACIIIGIPAIIAQEYLKTATGKLTKLDNITQLATKEKTRYYQLSNYFIDKTHFGAQVTGEVSGKYNEDFNMEIYIVIPILRSAADTSNPVTNYWLGKKYQKRISNRLSPEEKNQQFNVFANSTQKEFDATDFSRFVYLETVGNTNEHGEYNNALKNLQQDPVQQMVFTAQTEPFAARNGHKLGWVFGSLGIGLAVWLLILLSSRMKELELYKLESGEKTNDNTMKEILAFFLPRKDYYITPVIIDLNILIFSMMVFAGMGFISFNTSDLLNWGANFKPLTTGGQWWRLLTSTFLHGGIMHLLTNMYGLVFVGIFLEPLLGKWKYLAVYLITGILASVSSILWYDATVSVGASGAIFGLYGFFLAALIFKIFPPDFSKAFLSSTLIFVGFNLLMGLTGGIDNAAHIGGLVSGFILGLIMLRSIKQKIIADSEAATHNEPDDHTDVSSLH